jgi:uncharacterized membrane protein
MQKEINQIDALGIIRIAKETAMGIEEAAIEYAIELVRNATIKASDIEDDATKDANEKIEKAEIKASKIENDATKEADDTIGKAKIKASKIEKDAEEEAKKKEEEAKKKEKDADEKHKQVEQERITFELNKGKKSTCSIWWGKTMFSFIWEHSFLCFIGLVLLSGGIGCSIYWCHNYCTITRICKDSHDKLRFIESKVG